MRSHCLESWIAAQRNLCLHQKYMTIFSSVLGLWLFQWCESWVSVDLGGFRQHINQDKTKGLISYRWYWHPWHGGRVNSYVWVSRNPFQPHKYPELYLESHIEDLIKHSCLQYAQYWGSGLLNLEKLLLRLCLFHVQKYKSFLPLVHWSKRSHRV